MAGADSFSEEQGSEVVREGLQKVHSVHGLAGVNARAAGMHVLHLAGLGSLRVRLHQALSVQVGGSHLTQPVPVAA